MSQFRLTGALCPPTTSPFEALYEDEMRAGLAQLDAIENRCPALDAVAALFERLLDLPHKRALAEMAAPKGAQT